MKMGQSITEQEKKAGTIGSARKLCKVINVRNIAYFDNAATTFPKPEIVYRFMDKFYRECGVNVGVVSINLLLKQLN